MDTATTTNRRVTPWNKGKLLGQKLPLKLNEIWAIRIRHSWIIGPGNSHCSTSPSTASYADAIWSAFASTTWSRAVMLPPAQCHAEEDPATGAI